MSDVRNPPLAGRPWPLGQNIIQAWGTFDWWVRFKLESARWYLETLEAILSETGDLDRLMGVEMALDGYLAAASSSFDAAVALLIEALEFPVPQAERISEQRYNWGGCKAVATNKSVTMACEAQVDQALDGQNDAVPTGWLAVVRRLRNRTTHRDTLSRLFKRTLSPGMPASMEPTNIKLPDDTSVQPTVWARDMLGRLEQLTALILRDVQALRFQQGR